MRPDPVNEPEPSPEPEVLMRQRSRPLRLLVALALAAVALPALAYLLPTASVLRRMGERREALSLIALEVTGTVMADGPAADRLHAALSQPVGGGFSAPARFLMKVPGRCRLEVVGPTPAESPWLVLRDGKLSGEGGLDADPSATAMIRALCTLLGTSTAGDASGAYAAALARRGVALADESLGRFEGRVAYVIGGRPHEGKPLVYVDKDGFQPLRLMAAEGGVLTDVRLLGWGSPTGGEWFPRAVEAAQGDRLLLRFTTERANANPRFADGLL